MAALKQFYHETICEGVNMDDGPDQLNAEHLEALRYEKEIAMRKWLSLIYSLPAIARTAEQEAQLVEARATAMAARDKYWEAGGGQ